MKEFTRTNNGYDLKIVLDEEKLLEYVDEQLEIYQGLIGKELDSSDPDDDERRNYDLQLVNGETDEFIDPKEVVDDLNKFKFIIENLAASENGQELWDKVAYKKNGTFKKTSKPTLKEAINGSYWEDSYGWNTLVLRIEPYSDTMCKVTFAHIVIHY